MKIMGLGFDKFGNVVDLAGNKVKNYGAKMSEGYRKAKPFRPELLGVMFAGMAMNRAFGNLNATAKEWVGINEIMAETMGVLTLPTMLDFLDYVILPLSDAIMNLPEPLQKVVGSLSLLGEYAGTGLMTVGQLGLAMDAVEKFGFPVDKITNSFKTWGSKWGGTLIKAIGAVLLVYNVVNDIVFDEEGSLEIGNKIGASIGAGMLLGVGAAGVTFASLFALEMIQDPAAAGKFATNIMIFLGNAIASIRGGILALNEYIWDLILKPDEADKNLSENTWMQDFARSASDEVIDAYNKGGIATNSFVADIFNLQDEISGLSDDFDTSTDRLDVFTAYIDDNVIDSLKDLGTGFINMSEDIEIATEKVDGLLKSFNKLPTGKSINMNDLDWMTLEEAENQLKIYQGRAVGGTIGTTAPYLLHAGETVIPKSQNNTSNASYNVTYNVTVADKREFEAMLERNNRQLTQEVRRYIH
jgi:hypothetical protein